MERSGTAPRLQARDLAKSYGGHRVLDGFDLLARPGEVVAIVGENGAGKSTALALCAGTLRPDGGTVVRRGRLGYCPQEPGVVDLLHADEHLALFGAMAGLSRADAVLRGRRLLEQLHFPVGDDTVARDLSGGTRQKLNLALALLHDPDLLLLDEPYQGFDHGSYLDFWQHVDDWCRRGRTVIVVTHLLTERDRVDRVVAIRGGRAVEEPQVVESPERASATDATAPPGAASVPAGPREVRP